MKKWICNAGKESIDYNLRPKPRLSFFRFVGNGHARSEWTLTDLGRTAERCLLEIPKHFVSAHVDQYVIMPNHVHVILVLNDDAQTERACPFPTVSTVIGSYKSAVSHAAGFPVWQKSFYDHVIRNETDYKEIWRYIDENPMKWTLDSLFINP